MLKKKKQLTREELENIRMENELKKAKMILQYGAVIHESPEGTIDPIREYEFLKHVEQFEEAFQKAKPIPVYDFIGRPAYKKTDEIPDSRIGAELKRIRKIMQKKGVAVDHIYPVDDRTLYDFITGELFYHEMDDIHIPGMTCCFIYEEFHPNHREDIRRLCQEFIHDFIDLDSDAYSSALSDKAKKSRWFENFRQAYSFFDLRKFRITKVDFSSTEATVVYHINLTAKYEEINLTHCFSGKGIIKLSCESGYWYIDSLELPVKSKRQIKQ